MHTVVTLLLVALYSLIQARAAPLVSGAMSGKVAVANNACFPSQGFQPLDPSKGAPSTPLSNWWCPAETENGFFGFTYAAWDCQDLNTMKADFGRMRNQYKARYVRMYAWCDDDGTYLKNMISAAYSQGLGIYATIWFGFDGGNAWKKRRDQLVNAIKTNPLAPFVIRSVDVGSEPLYDWVLTPKDLTAEINNVKGLISSYGIKVSISEMKYGYSVQGDSQMVLDAEDVVHTHQLPFFDPNATTGDKALGSIIDSTKWFVSKTNNNRKIVYTQTGWPTNDKVWKANSPSAKASVGDAQAYYQLLDRSCEQLKSITPQGGVGWFWHIWKDSMLDGWGLLDWNGNPKWNFAPRTSC
ncbi:SubName: Full=Uncharacterized protein {ECO:0000313/EMBL:CCA67642.1} [Serendipita indica DSM 11827]|uniref:glucan endo-1,3-beta-D-glucosidase n=1 Tax=Serendipita indica (strain DSM 11827) TaxID=1109443 RepID=G4T8L5_SERID|nr:SubName: Full=Uncharacterized protein {ECO:0000313/EMBL:CCA67642.1} [Serendipita indica DSM 11827]CCA67642.1 hypothetical protein PIIN_01471 [Serendipita indica DSM 11827]